MRLLALAIAATGCQCLVPVSEYGDDAGRPDAGDGGNPSSCVPQQCPGPTPAQSLCFTTQDAGFSCYDGRCVFECFRWRTCTFDAGSSCLDCTGPSRSTCAQTGCGSGIRQGSVEGITPGCALPFDDVLLTPQGNCRFAISLPDGGTAGTITQLSFGEAVAQLPGFGTCIGFEVGSQVERWIYSCEGCQFVLRL